MTTAKVAREVCEQEFERFLTAMDLDVDRAGMDEDDRKSLASAQRIITRAMESGNLVINEAGEPVYTPQIGDTSAITFHEPMGATYMAMDTKKQGQNVGKLYASMADCTHQPAARFAKMANRDVKVCQAIVGLFLG